MAGHQVLRFSTPPGRVAHEISYQPIDSCKSKRHFRFSEVPLVAFACLIITADDTPPSNNECQPILE